MEPVRARGPERRGRLLLDRVLLGDRVHQELRVRVDEHLGHGEHEQHTARQSTALTAASAER